MKVCWRFNMNENVKKALKTMALAVISAVVSFVTNIIQNGGM